MRPAILVIGLVLLLGAAPALAATDAPAAPASAHVRALAVAQLPNGSLVGSTSDITVALLPSGHGDVFVSTLPLAQEDMQGSARLAVKVAAATTGLRTNTTDFLFLVKSDAPLIGGPSAGGIMTVATIAAMEGWPIRNDTLMTGTINPDGTIGPVGGVPEKAQAAAQAGAKTFLYPAGQEAQDGDIASYCENSLGITCRSVATIEDAVAALTGHAFAPIPAPSGAVTSPAFTALMRGAASGSLANATAQYDAASAALSSAALLSSTLRDNLQQHLDTAHQLLQNASDAQASNAYYTLSSRAFQASIETRYVLDTLEVAEAKDAATGTQKVLDNVTASVDAAQNATRALAPTDAANVQLVAAAQSRAADAARTKEQARSTAENATTTAQLLSAIHDLAYAEERAHTAVWWAGLARSTPAGTLAAPISPQDLTNAAQDAITEADDMVAYANLLVTESQADASQLQQAQQTLEGAKDELDQGLPAAAAYDATDATVQASLAIELIGVSDAATLDQRIQLARTDAEAAIEQARASGVEPVMAQSYYELATESASGVDQLSLLEQARTIARLDPTSTGGSVAGARPTMLAPASTLSEQETAIGEAAPWLAACAVGIVGVAIGYVGARRSRPPTPPALVVHAPLEREPTHPSLVAPREAPPPEQPPAPPAEPSPTATEAAWGPPSHEEAQALSTGGAQPPPE